LERKDGGLFLFVFIILFISSALDNDEDDDEEEEGLLPAVGPAIVQAISNPKYDARDCSHF